MHAKSLQLCPTLYVLMDCSLPGSSVHGDSPGKNTGVGCCAHLQGIFPTQELNPKSLTSPALEGGFFTTGTSGKLQEEGLLRAKSISESAWRYEEHCPSPQDTETFLVDHLIFK